MPRKKLPRSELAIHQTKRKWQAAHEEEARLLRGLFELINSRLTVNEISAIPYDRMNELVERLKSKEVTLQDLASFDANAFYEFATGITNEEID